jgi:hypothetical protein
MSQLTLLALAMRALHAALTLGDLSVPIAFPLANLV